MNVVLSLFLRFSIRLLTLKSMLVCHYESSSQYLCLDCLHLLNVILPFAFTVNFLCGFYQVELSKEELQRIIAEAKEELG